MAIPTLLVFSAILSVIAVLFYVVNSRDDNDDGPPTGMATP